MKKLLSVVAIVISSVLAVVSLPTVASAQDNNQNNIQTQDNPKPSEEELLAANPNHIKVISEDAVISQLGEWTNIFEQTDSTSIAALESLVTTGVLAESRDSQVASGSSGGASGSSSSNTNSILMLPGVPSSLEEVYPGVIKAQVNENAFYIQNVREFGVYKKGVRVFMKVTQAGIHKFNFPLNVPQNAKAQILASNQIIFINNDTKVPVGVIDSPWAIDADGKSAPASQAIIDNDLVVTVDASSAKLPVIVDPSYTKLDCLAEGTNFARHIPPSYGSPSIFSTRGTPIEYLNGTYCPVVEGSDENNFIKQHKYFPMWSSFRGRDRVVRSDGGCAQVDTRLFGDASSSVAITVPPLPPPLATDKVTFPHDNGFWVQELSIDFLEDRGFSWDFRVPCRAHDYCYDLEKSIIPVGNSSDPRTKQFRGVTKKGCDFIFYGDMRLDCRSRQIGVIGGSVVTPWSKACCVLTDIVISLVSFFRGAIPIVVLKYALLALGVAFVVLASPVAFATLIAGSIIYTATELGLSFFGIGGCNPPKLSDFASIEI